MKHYGIINEECKNMKNIKQIEDYLSSLKINWEIIMYPVINLNKTMKLKYDNKIKYFDKETNKYLTKIESEIDYDKEINNKNDDKLYKFVIIKNKNNTHHIFVPSERIDYYFDNWNHIYTGKINKAGSYTIKEIDNIIEDRGRNYIIYDLETIRNKSSNLNFNPISLSVSTYHTLTGYNNGIKNIDEETLYKKLEKTTFFYIQFKLNGVVYTTDYNKSLKKNSIIIYNDCILYETEYNKLNIYMILSKYIIYKAKNYIFSFNGSYFDNIFLTKSCFENNYKCAVSVYNGMIELECSIQDRNDYYWKTIDLRRFLGPGSLKHHCSTFIKNKLYLKKDSCNLFNEMEEFYYSYENLDKPFNNDNRKKIVKLIEYNNFDCISLALVYRAFISGIFKILLEGKKYIEYENENEIKTKEIKKTNIITLDKIVNDDDTKMFNNYDIEVLMLTCVSLPNLCWKLQNKHISYLSKINKKNYEIKFSNNIKLNKNELIEFEKYNYDINILNKDLNIINKDIYDKFYEKILHVNNYKALSDLKTGGRCQNNGITLIGEEFNEIDYQHVKLVNNKPVLLDKNEKLKETDVKIKIFNDKEDIQIRS